MAVFHREHAYVAEAFNISNLPPHKLAENQVPTQESRGIYRAATSGDVQDIESALASGGSPNWYNNSDEGATALHKAANGGHVGCIGVLLKSGSVIDERQLTSQNTPLHFACANGHLDAAKLLLSNSASINTGNSYGNAPINGAIVGGHWQIVELLLEEGADVGWTNNKGSTLLHFLAYSPMGDSKKEMIGRKLIEAGVTIDAQDEHGMTALHLGARDGNEAMAAFLLDNGADRTIKDAKGNTALAWAQINSHTAIVQMLLKDVNDAVPSDATTIPPSFL